MRTHLTHSSHPPPSKKPPPTPRRTPNFSLKGRPDNPLHVRPPNCALRSTASQRDTRAFSVDGLRGTGRRAGKAAFKTVGASDYCEDRKRRTTAGLETPCLQSPDSGLSKFGRGRTWL
ncbi:hypothetical protein HPB50_026755 [Hyalomma asiaticum]|uniref:Uncharacterized protein n=1 Tax=Hyalomma asiaticum TaxID=266040 RepID=A0ACB7RZ50_HYAAI|nr:hypothetical protein HPB50_026755 [Hyalomma asiaticum]